jgi:GNAT superfamily N-acetyltransferase
MLTRLTSLHHGSLPELLPGVDSATEPPQGVFYLVRRDALVVGMGGVRRTGDGASEMKRVFVWPGQRGGGLGATIVQRLIADATSFGDASMRLDSGPFMTSAHRLDAGPTGRRPQR